MSRWSKEQKMKALAMAEATTIRESAEQTGIPEGTIKRWRREQRTRETEPNEPNEPPKKKPRDIAWEAAEEAKEVVREYVEDRSKAVADELLLMVEKAVAESIRVLSEGPKEEEPNAGWLRAVVGAMAQGVEKNQLLTGQPTAREDRQVTQRHEYDITHKIEQYTDVYEKLAERWSLRGIDEGHDS